MRVSIASFPDRTRRPDGANPRPPSTLGSGCAGAATEASGRVAMGKTPRLAVVQPCADGIGVAHGYDVVPAIAGDVAKPAAVSRETYGARHLKRPDTDLVSKVAERLHVHDSAGNETGVKTRGCRDSRPAR